MNVVVDASVVLKWLIAEEDSEKALLLRANHDIAAPDLLLIECRNALLSKVRRRELQRKEAEDGKRALEDIESTITPISPDPGRSLHDCARSCRTDLRLHLLGRRSRDGPQTDHCGCAV